MIELVFFIQHKLSAAIKGSCIVGTSFKRVNSRAFLFYFCSWSFITYNHSSAADASIRHNERRFSDAFYMSLSELLNCEQHLYLGILLEIQLRLLSSLV